MNLKPGPVNPGLNLQQRFKAVGLGHCVWHIREKRGFFFDENGAFRMLMRGGLQVGISHEWWNRFLFSEDPKEWTILGGTEESKNEFLDVAKWTSHPGIRENEVFVIEGIK